MGGAERKDGLEQILKAIRIIRQQRGGAKEVLKVASLGYPDFNLTRNEVTELFGEDIARRLHFRYDHRAYVYGLRTTDNPEQTVSAKDIQRYKDIRKDDIHNYEKQCKNKRFLYDAFTLFSCLGLYCQVFDVVPRLGFETYVNLNSPIDPSFYGKFDLVIDWGVSEHIFNIGEHFKNCFRLLKPASVKSHNRTGGGIMIHLIPWEADPGNFYTIGAAGYRVDPGVLRDFYLYNECIILDTALYSNNVREPIVLHPLGNPTVREFIKNARKEYATEMHFIVQKTVDVPEIRIPIQRGYDFYPSLSHIFTFAPLVYDRTPRKADQSLLEDFIDLHPNQSYYDSLVRSLKLVCDSDDVQSIVGEMDYLEQPEFLQDRIEEILKQRILESFAKAVDNLAGKEVYFRIVNHELYEKNKKVFGITTPTAVLSSDTMAGMNGMTYDDIPIKNFNETIKKNPSIPIVVFADRRQISKACRELFVLSYPWPRLNLIPCWQ